MKHVLITGGAGFIGSTLARHIAPSTKVTIIDNLSSGKKDNIADIDCTFIEGSVEDKQLVASAAQGVDTIFHMAALASVPQCTDDPQKAVDVNCTGMLNVLEAAKQVGARVVFSSSCAIYGNAQGKPLDEHVPPNPLSVYASTKLFGEHLCKHYYEIHGVPTVILRYFNIFGEHQDASSGYAAVIPIFINLMLQGKQPTIFGDGLTTRDFTHVSNVVQANILAAQAPTDALGKCFNVGSGTSYSLNELVQEINNILGTSIEATYAQERVGDIKSSSANIDAIQEKLNYKLTTDFSEGLARTIEHKK